MRVLLVEDEAALAGHVSEALRNLGFAVDIASDGIEAHHLGATEPYDAVVLDLGLPKLDGLTVLHRWRAAGVNCPVLILTARGSWKERVQGIDAGADDYMGKPFRLEELLARVRALIRRSHGYSGSELVCGSLRLDPRAARVTLAGMPIALTAHEFKVLTYLMHHAGSVVSRAELIEHIYEQDFERESNTIEVFVRRLRRKVGVTTIETVRGLGYRLSPPLDA